MAISKKMTNALGVVGVVTITCGIFFGVIMPGLGANGKHVDDLKAAEEVGKSQLATIERAKGLSSTTAEQAIALQQSFQLKVPSDQNIESAARAIAAALPGGVNLKSFNFAPAQSLDPLKGVDISLEGVAPPVEFGAPGGTSSSAAAAPKPATSGDAAAKPSTGNSGKGFKRVPFTIEVTANDYSDLAKYLDNLAKQNRLMSVASINTTAAQGLTATVYAFAYLEG